MKKIFKTLIVAGAALTAFSCQEEQGRVEVPYSSVTGEFVTEFELTEPAEATDLQHFSIYNTADGTDSLWVEDTGFIGSKVKVKWDGDRKFSAEGGFDLVNEVLVDITGEVFPEKDSVHVDWIYHDLILLSDDPLEYVVKGNGVRYTGLDDDH